MAYSGKNVKICASHAGLTLGEDGATHQVLEDIGMMKMLPGMTVIVPCDFNQTKAATIAIAEQEGPVYLRFGRPKWANFTSETGPFVIGKAQVLAEGSDVTIIACGHLVWIAVEAADPGRAGHQRRSHQHAYHQAAGRGSHHCFRFQNRLRSDCGRTSN